MKEKLMVRILCFVFLVLLGVKAVAQNQEKTIRALNKKAYSLYQKEDYTNAEIETRKALSIAPNDIVAKYNLANTLYKTDRMQEAGEIYQSLLGEKILPEQGRADVAHNMGNVMMSAKQYAQAVEAYKQALRANPADEETRYNLALAQKLLKQQEEQQQNQNKNKQDDEQQQQQNQEKNKPKPEEQKKQPDQNPQQPEQAKEKMSQSNAQKILDAFLNDEKKVQKKVEKANQEKQQSNSNNKNW